MQRKSYLPSSEVATVKPSTPTTPQSSETPQPDAGSLSPRQYAPHLTDPDPPDAVMMTPLQSKLAAEKVRALIIKTRYWKE
jgi:hypothetical protein